MSISELLNTAIISVIHIIHLLFHCRPIITYVYLITHLAYLLLLAMRFIFVCFCEGSPLIPTPTQSRLVAAYL